MYARYEVSVASHMQEKKMDLMHFVREVLLLEGRRKIRLSTRKSILTVMRLCWKELLRVPGKCSSLESFRRRKDNYICSTWLYKDVLYKGKSKNRKKISLPLLPIEKYQAPRLLFNSYKWKDLKKNIFNTYTRIYNGRLFSSTFFIYS